MKCEDDEDDEEDDNEDAGNALRAVALIAFDFAPGTAVFFGGVAPRADLATPVRIAPCPLCSAASTRKTDTAERRLSA